MVCDSGEERKRQKKKTNKYYLAISKSMRLKSK